MDWFDIILIVIIAIFVVSLIIALIYFWLKTEKKHKINRNRKPNQKIRDKKDKDKTRDVDKQNIRDSDVSHPQNETTPEAEPKKVDKDLDEMPVSQMDDSKEDKTWSTISCTGSRDIRPPQTVPANELLESFGDYSPTNFRSPQKYGFESDSKQTESKPTTESQTLSDVNKVTEEQFNSENKPQVSEDKPNASEDKPQTTEDKPEVSEDKPHAAEVKLQAPEDTKPKAEDIRIEIPDNSSKENVTKSVEN